MREFRFFFISVFVVLLVMCFAYYSRLTPLLLTSVVLVCLFSLVLAVATRLCFSVETEPPPQKTYRRGEVGFVVRVKNNFIMPLSPIRVYVRVLDKGGVVPQKKMLIIAVPPLREVTLDVRNAPSFRGVYQIGVERVEFFDILKLFRFKVKVNKLWDTAVYPRELPSGEPLYDNESDTEVLRPNPHGLNKDSFSHLREYRAGESLRQIHWKLSARMPEGELIVKQMEATHDYSAFVFCDFSGVYNSAADFLETSDTVIETAQVVLRKILASGNAAVLARGAVKEAVEDSETQCVRREITDSFSYSELVEELAKLPAEPFGGSFSLLLRQNRGDLRPERAVYIVTAAVNDELVKSLREAGMEHRNNVSVYVVPEHHPALTGTPPGRGISDALEYLQTKTKINIILVEEQ